MASTCAISCVLFVNKAFYVLVYVLSVKFSSDSTVRWERANAVRGWLHTMHSLLCNNRSKRQWQSHLKDTEDVLLGSYNGFSLWGSSYYSNIQGQWRSHTTHLQNKSKPSQNQKPLRPELTILGFILQLGLPQRCGNTSAIVRGVPFSPESIFGFYLLTDSIASHLALIPVALIAVIPVFRSARDEAYSKPSGCTW